MQGMTTAKKTPSARAAKVPAQAAAQPAATLRRLQRMHWLLLTLSLLTVLFGVVGAHGGW